MQGPSLETPLSRMTKDGPRSSARAREETVYIQDFPLHDKHEGILLGQIALSLLFRVLKVALMPPITTMHCLPTH
jgi:hypothetical protein